MPTEFVPQHHIVEREPSNQHFHLPSTEINDFDVISVFREAASAPSLLSEYLADPNLACSHPKSKSKKSHRGSSTSHHGKPHRSASLLNIVLASEELQSQHFKSVLRNTGDRLEHEIRRAEQAESRATHAEMRVKEVAVRLADVEADRHHAQLEATRTGEEIKRYQMQSTAAERDLLRAREEKTILEAQRNEAEHGAARARDTAREYQMALREYEAKEEGREEARRISMQKWYDDGHADGFAEGRNDGFEKGLRVGREEGLQEGKEIGRKEERRNAIQAFDKFVASEMDDDNDRRQERTRQWAESTYGPNITWNRR